MNTRSLHQFRQAAASAAQFNHALQATAAARSDLNGEGDSLLPGFVVASLPAPVPELAFGNMSTPTQREPHPVASVPLILGISALLVWSIYILQRSGYLFPHSLERFVQHHLDGVAMVSFALAAAGIVLGLYLGRGGRRTRLLLWGLFISVAGALMQLLLPL